MESHSVFASLVLLQTACLFSLLTVTIVLLPCSSSFLPVILGKQLILCIAQPLKLLALGIWATSNVKFYSLSLFLCLCMFSLVSAFVSLLSLYICFIQSVSVPGSNPTCARIFSGSSHTSDLKIGTPVATLPGAWRYKVSAGTGRPGVSILWLGEMESFDLQLLSQCDST